MYFFSHKLKDMLVLLLAFGISNCQAIYIKLASVMLSDALFISRSKRHMMLESWHESCERALQIQITTFKWCKSRIMFLLPHWQNTITHVSVCMSVCTTASPSSETLHQSEGEKHFRKIEKEIESKCTLKPLHTMSFHPHYVPVSDRSPSITNPDSLGKMCLLWHFC